MNPVRAKRSPPGRQAKLSKGSFSTKRSFGNGEEVKRTRPSPAFRSLTFSPRRLCAHPRGTDNVCLFCFIHLRVLTETRMNGTRESCGRRTFAGRLSIFTLDDSNTWQRRLPPPGKK
jgi:hypothetical protein